MDIILKHYKGCSDYIRMDNNYTEKDLIDKMTKSFVKFNNITEYYIKRDNVVYIFIKNIIVPSQYDTPYNITSNQCSWISKEFLLNKKNIIEILNTNIYKLKDLYIKCMEKGTNERIKNFSLIQGENIDEINLSENNIKLYSTSNVNINIIRDMLGDEILNMIYKPNIDFVSYELFLNNIKNMENNKMLIINRDGQSFTSLKYDDYYIIFDSHIREIKFLNYDQFIMYLCENNPSGYFYFIYGFY